MEKEFFTGLMIIIFAASTIVFLSDVSVSVNWEEVESNKNIHTFSRND